MMNIKQFMWSNGFCKTRREAELFISRGRVMVNNFALTDDEYEVQPGDTVKLFVVKKAVLVNQEHLKD